MKLSFMGQKYSVNSINVETIPSDITVCFRGQAYALRRPVNSYKPQFGIRIYRGVCYCKKS